MLCAYVYPDTHLWRLFVVFSVMNSQRVSFRIPPKFLVYLPQSVLECVFNAQRCVRSCGEFSAYKGAAHVSSVSNKAVCVCVCVQLVRSQDLLTFILGHSLRNYMR